MLENCFKKSHKEIFFLGSVQSWGYPVMGAQFPDSTGDCFSKVKVLLVILYQN